jgi:hypothetical protein
MEVITIDRKLNEQSTRLKPSGAILEAENRSLNPEQPDESLRNQAKKDTKGNFGNYESCKPSKLKILIRKQFQLEIYRHKSIQNFPGVSWNTKQLCKLTFKRL